MSRLGGSCSPTSTELGQHRPSPFTIDAILSEDIGPRKPSSSPIVENPPCRPPWSPLNALLKTPPAKNGTASQLSQPSAPPSYQYTPNRLVQTTPSHITSPLNASFILNNSNNGFVPSDSICFDDSNLGILSAVACYHGELSSSESLTEKVEDLRVHSTSGDVSSLTQGDVRLQSRLLADGSFAGSSTPCILKRDRRRNKTTVPRSGKAVLTNSPSAMYKTPNKPPHKDNTFSPSIFLSHPNVSSSSSMAQGQASFDLSNSPHSEAEGAGTSGKSFVTSTPIRKEDNKENILRASPSHISRASPSHMSPPRNAKRKLLDEAIDAEGTARKPRLPYRNSKARTKLSPLLENSCSPISKAKLQPSLLSSAPLGEHQVAFSGVASSSLQSQSLPSVSSRPGNHKTFQRHHHGNSSVTGAVTGPAPKLSPPSVLVQSSPVSSQLNKTGQIQSVPPWFIFSTSKSESKRSRLAEAINRSLTEKTPTQATSKLPHGWLKLACGQTDDQIRLTEEARSFLCRPRQLAFDNAAHLV